MTLGDPFEEPPTLAFDSLAGLESLRTVGALSLRGVQAASLAVFYGLSELTQTTGLTPIAGLVFVDHCPALEDLQGLDNLTGMLGFVADGNERLTSLRGLRVPSMLNLFEIWDSPVIDIEPLESLRSVRGTLWFMNTGLTSASALAQLSRVDQLQFGGNAALTDLSALAGLSSVSYLDIVENPALERLPELPLLERADAILIDSNPALLEVEALPRLQSVREMYITHNPRLSRLAALSALDSASQVDVSHNAALEQLDIGRLGSIDYYLRVTHNPLLDSASVPRPTGGTVIVGGNLGEALELDPCPWSGNSFCESAPVDDLCAPGSASDCPSGEPL